MAPDIQAKEVIDKISRDLKIQPALQIPRELAEKIQLNFNVNPDREGKIATSSISDSAAGTIHITHATRRTFITGVQISVAKDAVNTSLFSRISATQKGGVTGGAILRIRYEPLTAASNLFASMIFPNPIELEKGTAVSLTNSTAIASIDSAAVITFFEVDPQ